jgi:cytochrome c6
MKKLNRILALLALAAMSTQAAALNLERGQRLYNLHCASCHGITGIPIAPDTPNLSMREGLAQPDIMLLNTIKMGKKTMPPYFGTLKDPQIIDIIQYMRTFR